MKSVNRIKKLLPGHHYIPGSGLSNCGLEYIHADYAGPFKGKMFLVLVDAYSKWLEVIITTSSCTIEHLRQVFAIHGLPSY